MTEEVVKEATEEVAEVATEETDLKIEDDSQTETKEADESSDGQDEVVAT